MTEPIRFGLKAEFIQKLQAVFAKFPAVEKVILYGSRAKGNYKPGSDIDLVIMGEKADLSMRLVIESEIDDLLLPYKVDLSIYRDIENPDLKDHIQRVGKVFFEIA